MFSHSDFTKENAQRLSVIVMSRMGRPPLQAFSSLPAGQQQTFNRMLNEYIKMELNIEEWNAKLINDFNTIVDQQILHEGFDPSKQYVPIYNTVPELLLSEEQKRMQETSNVDNNVAADEYSTTSSAQ